MAKHVDISKLRSDVQGRVIISGDSDYDKARTVFYGGIDKHPAAVVLASNNDDVSKVISIAKENGMELAVRSGGHSLAGHSVSDGGFVLDLHNLRTFEIDIAKKTVWVGPGLTAGEYTVRADNYDLATGFGDTGSVGVGGITLGGGIGFLVRKYGLAIDNLLAAEIITADGKLRHIDEKNEQDLFWAIRGGGGNFGVVTRYKFKLHEMNSVVGGMLILPATPEVIAGFIEEAKIALDELSAIANIMPAPPMPMVPSEYHGKLIVMALMMYVGELRLSEQTFAPFKALAKPIADLIRPMRYKEIFFPDDESYHPTAVARNMFMNTVDNGLAQTIVDSLNLSDAPMRVVQLRVLGGAMARVPVEATAFAHRKSPIMVNVAAFYQGSTDRVIREEWVLNLAKKLFQGDRGVYIGFTGNEGEARIHDAYPGDTWKRLSVIKRKYDPTNLFRLNHNIPPEE